MRSMAFSCDRARLEMIESESCNGSLQDILIFTT